MYPTLHFFGHDIALYALLAIAGVLAACAYAFASNRGGKAGRLREDDLLHILLLAVVGVLIGAKVLGVLTALPVVVKQFNLLRTQGWLAVLITLSGGLVFYGGAIGGLVAVELYCRKYKISFKTTLGLLTPAIPLFHTFGRIGCFLAGCCWGIQAPLGLVYRRSPAGAAPNGVSLLPVPLIEASCNFILFLLLALLTRRLQHKWAAILLYAASYGIIRFILEFFRGDAVRGVWLLSTSQWISLAVLVLCAVLGIRLHREVKPPATHNR